MKFSERIGATQPALDLHLDSMPPDLRTTLWNYFLSIYDGPRGANHFEKICKSIANDFIKFPADELPSAMQTWDQKEWIKKHFYALEWYEVYNLIEFLKNKHLGKSVAKLTRTVNASKWHPLYSEDIELTINNLLEREHSGYRFVSGLLAPITDKTELSEVSTAVVNLNEQKLIDVKKHLTNSIELFTLKPTADYKNSIKESTCAVETLLKQKITPAGRGIKEQLRMLPDRIKIHPALCESIEKMYAFASDEPGIRHGTWGEDNDIGYFEAKYMLVMSAAFVNYFLGKDAVKQAD